jgi:hypothetical protein
MNVLHVPRRAALLFAAAFLLTSPTTGWMVALGGPTLATAAP